MFLGKVLQRTLNVMLIGILAVGVIGLNTIKVNAQASPSREKAIVVVSFGTTFADARQSCIEGVENKIRKNFPDYEVRRAFTSKIVMKRLAENDKLYIDSLEQALDKLKKEGFKEVIVQTTHLTPGEEYDKKVVAVVEQYAKMKAFDEITIGRPVLFFQGKNGTPDDFAILVKALESQIPIMQIPGRYVVFMGHGSPHQPNPAYQLLQEKFNAAGLNVLVGVVEESDHPNFEDIKALLLEKDAKKITLMPLMLVAGDHANNDMAGAEPDSWKNQLAAEGFQLETYIHGLGENAAVQDIYVQHVRDAIHGSYK